MIPPVTSSFKAGTSAASRHHRSSSCTRAPNQSGVRVVVRRGRHHTTSQQQPDLAPARVGSLGVRRAWASGITQMLAVNGFERCGVVEFTWGQRRNVRHHASIARLCLGCHSSSSTRVTWRHESSGALWKLGTCKGPAGRMHARQDGHFGRMRRV